MPFKEWTTNYPTTQDADPITGVQPDLDNDPDSIPSTPGDGDNTRTSQVMAMRNKLQAVCKKVGDDGDLPGGCLLDRVTILESGQDFTSLTDTPANYVGHALKSVRVNAGQTALEFFVSVATDEKVSITAADTTPDYLNPKIVSINGIVKSTLNPGANEQIQFAPTYGILANTFCVGNDARLSDARTPVAHKVSHENGGGDEISVAGLSGLLADDQNPVAHAADHALAGGDDLNPVNLSSAGTAINFVAVTDGANGFSYVARASLDTTAVHDNVAGEILAVAVKAAPGVSDVALIEDVSAANAKKRVTLGSLVNLMEGIDASALVNTPATVNVNIAVDVTGGDLSVGTYEVTLTTDLTDGTGVSAPSDMIIGVLKADDSAGGGGTGPANIGDGIPIVVWGTQKIKIVAGANDRIWFMRSDQTEFKCLVYIAEVV